MAQNVWFRVAVSGLLTQFPLIPSTGRAHLASDATGMECTLSRQKGHYCCLLAGQWLLRGAPEPQKRCGPARTWTPRRRRIAPCCPPSGMHCKQAGWLILVGGKAMAVGCMAVGAWGGVPGQSRMLMIRPACRLFRLPSKWLLLLQILSE